MNKLTEKEITQLIDRAVDGDRDALEAVLSSVQDLVFNLSLRMLGTFPDAEDASQDIILKIITHLSSFQKDSSFSTWVFSIASNHLRNYKKHMFAHAPLSFDFYGDDIKNADLNGLPDLTQSVDKNLLAEELKLSCTNVMLQCLDPESRCVFILGTMFRLDSREAGAALAITPEAYRQKLSRARKRMAEFLSEYCGEYGRGDCRCARRLNYAIQAHRLDPHWLSFTAAEPADEQTTLEVKRAMEEIDGLSDSFSFCKMYGSPESTRRFIEDFLSGPQLSTVKNS